VPAACQTSVVELIASGFAELVWGYSYKIRVSRPSIKSAI
jgi:hypothetical protein